MKANLESMGLVFDANRALKTKSTKRKYVERLNKGVEAAAEGEDEESSSCSISREPGEQEPPDRLPQVQAGLEALADGMEQTADDLEAELAMEATGSAGGVKAWSLVGSGGGVGREGEGVEEGSLLFMLCPAPASTPPTCPASEELPPPEYPG